MANSLTGTIIAEKYRLGDVQRSGVEGDLYDARHVLMDKPASIFVLRPSLAVDRANVDSFFAEAKIAAGVNSPYTLELSDFGTDREGHVYAVYESLAGKPLSSVIAEDGAFPVHSSVEIARQAAEGIAAAHAAGQVHGNLSAGNIYLTGENGISTKVVDFGSSNPIIAERTDAADFAYLSPEQSSGSEKADERSDVYSLGVVLYEMLAGVPPFIGERPTDVMLKHIEEMPSPLSAYRTDVPEALESSIVKALSKNPEMRQQSASEFADELAALYSDIPQAAAAPQNNLWKTAFVVLVGMSLLAAFMIYGTYTKQTDPTTAMQPDANGMPVQPINPATGAEEQNLASMPALTVDAIANSNMTQPPGTLAGGDGYNPWGNGGVPPPGAPYIPPGGQVVTIDPATGSPFMPPDGVMLVPVPMNTNTNSARPTPTPRTPAANSNTPVPQPTPATAANTTAPKPSPTPRRTPARPATNRPAANTPASGDESN
jgi:serine/threonine protein kinase